MKKITIGTKYENENYDFRETCFGIVVDGDELYCTEKNGEISLIGGGIEPGETQIECLKREFLEEAGCYIKEAKELCTIDCFWITRNQKYMESLANIYVVEILDKIVEPTEKGNRLIKIKSDKAIKVLELPYQKKAVEEYMNFTKRNLCDIN